MPRARFENIVKNLFICPALGLTVDQFFEVLSTHQAQFKECWDRGVFAEILKSCIVDYQVRLARNILLRDREFEKDRRVRLVKSELVDLICSDMRRIWLELTVVNATYVLHALRVPTEALHNLRKEPFYCGAYTRLVMERLARLFNKFSEEAADGYPMQRFGEDGE